MQRMNAAISKSYRVVQWATGNIGARALRAVIEHPKLTLAGVYVTSEQKAGRDAGELCGVAAVWRQGDAQPRRDHRAATGLRALHATRLQHG